MSKPAVGRICVWVDCVCGSEVEFEDLDPEGMTSQPCDDCGRTIEVWANVGAQDISSAAVRRRLEGQ